MESLRTFLHLGDVGLVLPLAAAIGAWLAATRAWRLLLWWCLLLGTALAMVGVSKIAYLAWGGGWPALSFKSFSGHAAGAMALFPMLFYLMMPDRHWRRLGLAAGALLAMAVAVLLVALREHSPAEAAAGCLLGAAASLGSLRLGGPPPAPPHPASALALAGLAFATLAWLLSSAHVGYWMIKVARAVSGHTELHSLSID